MSHFSKIKTQIVDKALLLDAIQALGYEIQAHKTTIKGFRGEEAKADICLSIPGETYEIGFLFSKGNYQILADWWGFHTIDKKTFRNQIMQKYAYLATRQSLENQGFQIAREEIAETGEIKMILRRMV